MPSQLKMPSYDSYLQGRQAVGHPVDVGSGTFFCAWHDIEIGGYAPLVLRRYYSTGLTTESLAGLGTGWTHNFAMSLTKTAQQYRFRDQSGGVVDFPIAESAPESAILNAAASMELRSIGDCLCLYHWHDWRTGVETLWFRCLPNGLFRLEKISPPCGFGLELSYDSTQRLSTVVQMIERRRIIIEYTDRGLVGKVLVASDLSAPRIFAEYGYDDHDQLVAVYDAAGAAIRYSYDSDGRIVKEATRSGAVFQMRYDGAGRCVSTRGADGHHACRLKYLPSARVTLVTNSLGDVTAYAVNGSGQVVTETRPNGAVLSTRYDAFGRMIEQIDPLHRLIRYFYDERSDTVGIVYHNGLTEEIRYDCDHQPIFFRQGDSVWRFSYAHGQLISIVGPDGQERRYGYDVRGFMATMAAPSGNTTRIEPDEGWNRVRVVDDYGLDREEHYDELMHISQISEPDGAVYRFASDTIGRLVRASSPESAPREYRYDSTGNLAAATDAEGHTVSLRHNVYGLLEEVVTPTGRTYRCTWDTEGRLKTWTNPADEQARIEHDAMGNETRIQHFDGRIETFGFDRVGRAVWHLLANGTEVGFAYDDADNLFRVSSGGVDLIVNDYDLDGRLLRTKTPTTEVYFEYNEASQVVAETQNGRRIAYAYDSRGTLRSRSFSGSPLPPLEFDWDQRLRLAVLRRGGVPVQTFRYDEKDHCVERRFANCREDLEYSTAGQLVGQTVLRAAQTLLSRGWNYDQRGGVARIRDSISGEKRYRFDGDHRLIGSQAKGKDASYDYDRNGNLVFAETGLSSSSFQYLSGNRLTRLDAKTISRDSNGNVTEIRTEDARASLRWDPLGQLIEVCGTDGSVIRYSYDGLGRRLRREADDKATEFVWSGDQLLAEISGTVTTEYFFSGTQPLVYWRGTRVHHLITTHIGVPSEAVNEWGTIDWTQRLGDWGGLEYFHGAMEERIPLRLPGQYAEDEYYYNRFRYYDPEACQYLSPDSLGLGGGANEYMYCPNPIDWADPFGLSCGIPPGQHSVYVLEKGPPPKPPRILYVGITRQSPHDRLAQHKADPPKGVPPDAMRIIATGPPQVPDRTAARLIEASILKNSPQPLQTGIPKNALLPGNTGPLLNAERPKNTGTYYHSNVPTSAPAGTTHLPPSATKALLNPNNGTTIT